MSGYSEGERDGSALEDGADSQHKGGCVILKFGDLGIEANRIAYVEAMVMDRVVSSLDGDAYRLGRAFVKLPRRTMNEVVATSAKLSKAYSQRAALLLKGFERCDVANGCLKAVDTFAE